MTLSMNGSFHDIHYVAHVFFFKTTQSDKRLDSLLMSSPVSSCLMNTASLQRFPAAAGQMEMVLYRRVWKRTAARTEVRWEDEEVRLTSVVGERAVRDELSWLQAVHQRAHPPWTPEKRVSPRAECAQLLHAPLFRAPVLEPHLTQTGNPNTHLDNRRTQSQTITTWFSTVHFCFVTVFALTNIYL